MSGKFEELTPKEKEFLDHVLEGCNLSEAYRRVYPDASPSTVNATASPYFAKIKKKLPFKDIMKYSNLGKERIVEKLESMLEAKQTRFFQDRPIAEVSDNPTQLKALTLLCQLHNLSGPGSTVEADNETPTLNIILSKEPDDYLNNVEFFLGEKQDTL